MSVSPDALHLKKKLNMHIPEKCRNCRHANRAALDAATVAVEQCIDHENAQVCFVQTIGKDCEEGLTIENEGKCNEKPICAHPRKDEIASVNWGKTYQIQQ